MSTTDRGPTVIVVGDLAAADNIARSIAGERRTPFRYFDRRSMASIGRATAVAEIRKLHLSGFLAWLAWVFVHLLFLIGFENRLLVMLWATSYISYERGARLITGPWHADSLNSGTGLGD